MKIEVRRVLEYKPGCDRIQFYIAQPNPALLSLIQVDDTEATVKVTGDLLLELAGKEKEDTLEVYFVGVMDDGQLFTFEPHQEIKFVDKDTTFLFKGVEMCWEPTHEN